MSLELALSEAEIRLRFARLMTYADVANLLDIPINKLYYYGVVADLDQHYKQFDIPKATGGVRRIYAPSSPLKIIQRKLNQVFQAVYVPKASVHGFVSQRSILTNAKRHLETRSGRRYVLNVDLEDFFPSINFYRVRGLFNAKPYNLPYELAELLARLCCLHRKLPQGAPTSPVISNMICARMDTQLRKLAQEAKCIYTRYADDITFSTSLPYFPSSIATLEDETGNIIVGTEFARIIQNNGFAINSKKIRLRTRYKRQEVTGLTINQFPNVGRKYVRQIRAMLHALEKYGLERAQKEFNEKYAKGKKPRSFLKVLRGKIEFLKMVRGEENLIYISFSEKLGALDPDYKTKLVAQQSYPPTSIHILTEGKTDWKHLKAALSRLQARGEFTELDVQFWEYGDEQAMNDTELLKYCRYRSKDSLEKSQFYIFDRDDLKLLKDITDPDKGYKNWGNQHYSFPIPVPAHRVGTPEVCIELYYQDHDLKRLDVSGKRLFLSNEFDKKSCRHLDPTLNLSCLDRNKVRRSLAIIDDEVFDAENRNVALPKNDFANYVLEGTKGFSDIDFAEFRSIFGMIRRIIKETS